MISKPIPSTKSKHTKVESVGGPRAAKCAETPTIISEDWMVVKSCVDQVGVYANQVVERSKSTRHHLLSSGPCTHRLV